MLEIKKHTTPLKGGSFEKEDNDRVTGHGGASCSHINKKLHIIYNDDLYLRYILPELPSHYDLSNLAGSRNKTVRKQISMLLYRIKGHKHDIRLGEVLVKLGKVKMAEQHNFHYTRQQNKAMFLGYDLLLMLRNNDKDMIKKLLSRARMYQEACKIKNKKIRKTYIQRARGNEDTVDFVCFLFFNHKINKSTREKWRIKFKQNPTLITRVEKIEKKKKLQAMLNNYSFTSNLSTDIQYNKLESITQLKIQAEKELEVLNNTPTTHALFFWMIYMAQLFLEESSKSTGFIKDGKIAILLNTVQQKMKKYKNTKLKLKQEYPDLKEFVDFIDNSKYRILKDLK